MAKHTYSDKVFLTLKHKIARLDSLKIVNHLISDTDSDFTRKRKLPFLIMTSTLQLPLLLFRHVPRYFRRHSKNYCICLTMHILVMKHLKDIDLSQSMVPI